MKLRRKLFSSKDPYDVSKSDLFLHASKENFNYLYGHCDDYKKISDGLSVKSQNDIKDVSDIPVLPTMLFKQHDFRSGRYMVKATSSGTSGKKSTILFSLITECRRWTVSRHFTA